MSAFDFNRYRTVENPSSCITARDLQKARRSAARSTIKKSKSATNSQKKQHPAIKDGMSSNSSFRCKSETKSRTAASLVSNDRLDNTTEREIRSGQQANKGSEMANTSIRALECYPTSPFRSSFHSAVNVHQLSTEGQVLLMQSYAPCNLTGGQALLMQSYAPRNLTPVQPPTHPMIPLSAYLGNSPRPSTPILPSLPPWLLLQSSQQQPFPS